jgi:endonuclease YncB( thermonuclease family)
MKSKHRWQVIAWASCGLIALHLHGAESANVLQVIDGDTCRLSADRDVRYLGIDAPEKGDLLAEEATQANNRLVGGKAIRLEIGKPAKDRNGRLLAYVFVDKLFINEEMVRLGFAYVRRPVTAKHKEALLRAQKEAQAAGRGIWGSVSNVLISVNAIRAKPDTKGDKVDLNDECIVLENRGRKPLDMTGWSILDEGHHRYLVPQFVLPAGGKVTLRTGSGKNTSTELFWGNRVGIWNNNGDSVFIKDAQGRLVQSHVY